jgi:hypothetical protein
MTLSIRLQGRLLHMAFQVNWYATHDVRQATAARALGFKVLGTPSGT